MEFAAIMPKIKTKKGDAKQQYAFPPVRQYFISWAGLASEFGMGSGVSLPLWPFGIIISA